MAEPKYNDKNRLMDYRATFASPEGKRVLLDLIARHYLLGSTFDDNPAIMAHAEGQREVVLQIMRYTQMTPQDIPGLRTTMLQQFELEDVEEN